MSKLWAERATALAMFVFALIFVAQSIDMPGTSGTFPKFTEYVVILLAVVMLLRTLVKRVAQSERFQGDVRFDFSYRALKPVYVMAVAIVYGFAIFSVGFYVSSIVFYFLVTYMTGIRNFKVMTAVAVILFPLMYVFFNIALEADLPQGFLF